MKLEYQVTSLELSKKLQELGVKQESLFYWGAYENPLDKVYSESDVKYFDIFFDPRLKCGLDYYYSAFTASELLEILPEYLIDEEYADNEFYIKISKDKEKIYFITYINSWNIKKYDFYLDNLSDKKLSDSLANMLIYLIENKLMEIK